jgi:DNA-binding transcriptional regulator YdaS (Cro superfamily)
MDKFIEWLNAVAGRRVRLAEHLKVKPPVVSEWVTGKRPVPIVHGAAIEQFTNGQVTRQDLFPNDWQQIWPELAQPAATSN